MVFELLEVGRCWVAIFKFSFWQLGPLQSVSNPFAGMKLQEEKQPVAIKVLD